MIEVRSSDPTAPLRVAAASTKGTIDSQKASGNSLPPPVEKESENAVATEPKAPEKTEIKLETEVASINDYVQSIQRDLQFSIDDDLEQTVIKVVDKHSGELIRQIPEEVFLELARNLKEDGELRLINALG